MPYTPQCCHVWLLTQITYPRTIWPSPVVQFGFALFHSFTHSNHPFDDVWAPNAWSEIIQQNNIQEMLILSLPNPNWSALKDHYPFLQAQDTLLSHTSFPVSPLTDNFFNYPQDVILKCSKKLTYEWAQSISSHPPLLFGAIGQQGLPTCSPVHLFPIANPSLFCFLDFSASMSPSSC